MNGVDEKKERVGNLPSEVNEREKKVINRSAWGDEEINFLSFLPSFVLFLLVPYILQKGAECLTKKMK